MQHQQPHLYNLSTIFIMLLLLVYRPTIWFYGFLYCSCFICNTVGNLCIGLEVEGIYRVSGMKSKVEALKESYDQGM